MTPNRNCGISSSVSHSMSDEKHREHWTLEAEKLLPKVELMWASVPDTGGG